VSATLLHKYATREGCAGDPNKSHDWKVARIRGKRSRSKCSGCGAMTPWEKTPMFKVVGETEITYFEDLAVKPNEVVQQPSNVDLVYAAAQEERDLVLNTYWNNMTLREAQQLAKEKEMRGYSKLRKDDLIAALQKIAGVS
jgi:hypothetical protein